jgi:hypothetical protein
VPRNKDLKRIVRDRIKKTGESYTAARAHIISKTKQPLAPASDLAALAGKSDETISAKTGRTWQEWVRVLDADHAARMRHGEIAAVVHDKYHVNNWWSQMVTVGYERIKGLRGRGQRLDGFFEINKTRTFSVPVKTLFDAWARDAARRRWLDADGITVRSAASPKSIRLRWPDGTLVVVWLIAKGATKSTAAVVHTKLPDRVASDKAKRYWADRLEALGQLLLVPGNLFTGKRPDV